MERPKQMLLWAAFLLSLCVRSEAHELVVNRATLVLRDDTHVSITLYIAYADVLHAALAPRQTTAEFLTMYSAMNMQALQKQLTRAQALFQAGIKLYLPSGQPIALSNWIWPDPHQVQSMIQQRIMQAMVDPTGHAHDEPLEIHVDANSPQKVVAVRAQFPVQFQQVLVVWYHPSQFWVEPNTWSPALRF
jgi:hypothetical protein